MSALIVTVDFFESRGGGTEPPPTDYAPENKVIVVVQWSRHTCSIQNGLHKRLTGHAAQTILVTTLGSSYR